MNLSTKQKESDIENNLMVTKGGEGINQEYEINRQTLLYIKQTDNKDLLQSKRNYTQNLVITYNGKESEKDYIYIYACITESLCCTPETNTIL